MAVCAAAPVHVACTTPHTSIAGLVTGCVGFLLVAVILVATSHTVVTDERLAARTLLLPATIVPALAFGLVGRYAAQEQALPPIAANTVVMVPGVLFLQFVTSGARRIFAPVIEAEVRDDPPHVLSSIKWRAYLALSSAFASTLLCNVTLVMAVTPKAVWRAGAPFEWEYLAEPLAALPAVVMLLYAVSALPPGSVLRPVAVVVLCGGWAAVVTGLAAAAGFGGPIEVALSTLAAVIAGLFVGESVASHLGPLHDQRVRATVIAVAVSAGTSVAATVGWMVGSSLHADHGVRSVGTALGALAVGSAAMIAIPPLAARVLPQARPPLRYVICDPRAGVLQDSFVVTVLAVSVGWVPNFFIAHINDWSALLGAVLSYFALLSAAYVWVMRNNVTHYGREVERMRRKTPNAMLTAAQQRALAGLRGHIIRQNVLAMIAVLPTALSQLRNEVTGFDEKGIKGLLVPVDHTDAQGDMCA